MTRTAAPCPSGPATLLVLAVLTLALAATDALAGKPGRNGGARAPDLVLESLALDPSAGRPGTTITAIATLRNAGSAKAKPTDVGFWLGPHPSDRSGAIPLATVGVGSLAPRKQIDLVVSLQLPPGVSPGTHYVQALADARQVVAEPDEDNNLAAAAVAVTASTDRVTVWVADSLARVQRLDAPGPRTSAALSAARNEYESVQVVVAAPPDADLTGVDVRVSDLVGPSTIPKDHVAIYRAHFIAVTVPSRFGDWSSPHPPGDWADALIPRTVPGGTYESFPFSVRAGQNQPVWVEVYVPPGTAPGTYAGTVTVIADGVDPVAVPVTLTVWGFTLPERPSLASDFGTYDTWFSIAAQHSAGATRSLLKANLYRALDAHRLGLGVAGLDAATDAWMRTHAHMLVHPLDSDQTLREIKAHFDANGWGRFLRHYGPDEPSTDAGFARVREESARFRALGIPMMVTIKIGTAWTALDGVVDIWVPVHYELVLHRAAVAQRLARGDEVWSYTAGLQPNGAPTWLLDYDLIHYRIVPWLDYATGLSGLLYWATAAWDLGDPWTNAGNHNQDGVLFYPGDRVGDPDAAIPSARLKAIRDGMEDHEYLTLLAALGDPGLAAQLAAELAPAWDAWTRDPVALAAVRERAAAAILGLGGN